MDRIFGFDLARSLAIGLVVMGHLWHGAQPVGMYGVELFFALSGFLIGTILYRCVPENGRWTFAGVANFWQRRWWRTLPNYYLFLVAAIVFHGLRSELPEGGWAGFLPYLFFCQNLVSPNETFYHPSWSLCVEEAFYLLFPLGVLLFHRVTDSRSGAFILAGIVVFLGSAALREVVLAQYQPADVRVSTLPRLDAIACGVAIAVLVQTTRLSPSVRIGMAAGGSFLIAVTVVAHFLAPVNEVTWFYRGAMIALPLGFSLMMPLLGAWNSLPSRWEKLRLPITALSQWSYSIYLSHFIVIAAIYPLFGSLRDYPAVNLLSKAVGLILTIVVSRWVFLHFESRFTAKRPPEKHFAAPEPGESPSPSSARA